jgi:GNAT superfamily N-acetyltransferase
MIITLREIQPGDRDLIAAVGGGPAWKADIARWAEYQLDHQNGRRIVLLAFEQGKPVGYGTLKWASDYLSFLSAGIPEVNDLVVAAHARRRGIGTAIIQELEQRARGAGKQSIGIGVGLYADYGSAQRLYIRLGFQPDGCGVTYANKPVLPGSAVVVDDDLLLWFTKSL